VRPGHATYTAAIRSKPIAPGVFAVKEQRLVPILGRLARGGNFNAIAADGPQGPRAAASNGTRAPAPCLRLDHLGWSRTCCLKKAMQLSLSNLPDATARTNSSTSCFRPERQAVHQGCRQPGAFVPVHERMFERQ
jgi:hypothetical protein